jgi:signal transduction histidine kinase
MLAIVALLVLLACLAYNSYLIWATPDPGITYNARWQVLAVAACNTKPADCPEGMGLQPGDRLLRVGGITYDKYVDHPDLVPFGGYSPGDVIRLRVLRDEKTFDLLWLMPELDLANFLRFGVVSLLVYGSFWLAGTYVLRYVRPADLTWVLLITLFYLTTIWLAVGLYTVSNVAYSAIVLRIVGWIMAPVMVHLHLAVPTSRPNPRHRNALIVMYAAALVLLLLQLVGLLPWLAYLGGIMVAALISISLLVYRLLTPRAPTEKLIARLMLAGILLSLVPGLVLSAIPLLLDLGATDAFGAALSILALPVLPFFYSYAIYRHRLGLRERRVNRLLVQYVLVLTYFILLSLVFLIMANWAWTANAPLSFITLLGLSVVIALLPIRRPVQTVLERLTYGTRYSHRLILTDFAQRIPAAVDTQELLHLLKYELAPELEIRQSALMMRNGEQLSTLYAQGVVQADLPSAWAEASTILETTEQVAFPGARRRGDTYESRAWIQLALPLRLKDRMTGIWLFGRRDRDNIYSQEDVDLLDRLSGLVTVTLESGQLLHALTEELEIRKQTEGRLAEQSERLRLLHEIDRAILAAGTPAEIARAAFFGLNQLVPCVRVSVFLFDADHNTLTILAAQGRGTDIIAEDDTVPLTASPAFEKLLKGQVFVADDVGQKAPDNTLAGALAPAGVRTVISAPLVASGAVFGALSVANSQPASYTPTHVAIVEEVATSIALAIRNARLTEEVNRNSQELRRLSTRLIDAHETERKRLSHELHDEMGQMLTAISLNLAAIERNLPESSSQSLKDQLADANDFVLGLTDQVRSLSLALRPSMLHDLGLGSTLRWYVSNYARRNDAEIGLQTENLPEHLPESVEITAYRVIQEALTNTSRHAAATQVDLTVSSRNGCVQVVVEDNGRGFEMGAVSSGLGANSGIGIAMMRERVAAADGRLEVQSEPGRGTRIVAVIPIKEEKAA